MTDDATWIRLLDAEPDNWGARLIYSDWLEEQDEGERAEGQRFQAENQKRPEPPETHESKFGWGECWNWWSVDGRCKNSDSHSQSQLPDWLYRALAGQAVPASSGTYRTRHEAELALAAALAKLKAGEVTEERRCVT